MISHEEIKNLVTQWNIREDIVEKDYIIGWILWGIGQDQDLGHKWVFKGGTCLKKCYFETWRFSEDLDFTVLPDGPYKPGDILPIVNRILARVSEESGINFSAVPARFKQKVFPFYTEGRIYYQGPRRAPTPASIKIDLNAFEKVVCPPQLRKIFHAYSDKLPHPGQIMCYSLEEIFAEKIRAMGERGYPRDLYDIVFIFRGGYFHSENALIKSTLLAKCQTKDVPCPTFESIRNSPGLDELKSEWANMLSHQLPALPPFEEQWNELPSLFAWLEEKYVPERLEAVAVGRDEEIGWQPPPVIWNWGIELPLESIRFAAVNHLCIELGYDGTKRTIEPYSLRKTKTGNLLLCAVKTDTRETRTYRVDRIQSIKVTTKPFKPVYQIEFYATGTVHAPQITKSKRNYKFSMVSPFGHKTHYGPTYVFRCSLCGKVFKRKEFDSTLRQHKNKNGLTCFGTMGMYIKTEY